MIFLLKFQILCWIFFMPKKMTLICLKYFLENISSLNHHIMKEKKIHTIPHHQINVFWKTKKTLTFLPWKTTKLLPPMSPKNTTQPNFSLPCHPKTQPLIVVSILKSKITSPNPTPKTPLKKGEIILSSSKNSILNCVHHLFWPNPHELG